MIVHQYNRLWWDFYNSVFHLFPSLHLTLIGVEPSEARVPLGVWVVGVEGKREAAPRGGEERGINIGLKILKFSSATQNWDQVSIWKDLGNNGVVEDTTTLPFFNYKPQLLTAQSSKV